MLCVVLAVVLDAAIVLAEKALTPWTWRTGRARRSAAGMNMNVFGDTWDYLTDPANWQGPTGIWHLLLQQLLLSFTALAVAVVIGLPIALWLGHLGRGGFLAINVSNIGPRRADVRAAGPAGHRRLARHGPLRPLRSRRPGHAHRADALRAAADHHQRATSPSVRCPPTIREAADGMGMTGWQKFARVELPLAMPLIISGVRLALVQVWATATIAALVAGPGLGRIITDGFYRTNYAKGIAGAIVVAAVALVLELIAAAVQRAVRPVRIAFVAQS